MSKKLIAVAAATVLAIAGLAVPANAASTATLVAGGWDEYLGSYDGSTAAKAATVDVPDYNEISTVADTAGEIDIDADSGASVTVTSTGAVKLLKSTNTTDDASEDVDNTKAGKSSLTFDSTGSDSVYVYTTSTVAGTVTVKITTSTTTYNKTFYVKGIAGDPYYFVNVKGTPSVLAEDDSAEVSIGLTDVFGNAILSDAGDDYVELTMGNYDDSDNDWFDWDGSEKAFLAELTSPSDNGFIGSVSIDVSRVDGFAAPSKTVEFVINAKGSADLQTQVSALEAKLANSVTKKKYNALAKKWNAAFPSKAVALKK